MPLWIPIATLVVASITAAWNILRDRSHLGQLERITTVAGQLSPGSRPFAMMRDLRDKLAVQVALATEAPPHRARLIIGWVLFIVGFGVALAWATFAIGSSGLGALRYPFVWVTYLTGLAAGLVGQGILTLRDLAITAWKDARLANYPNDDDLLQALTRRSTGPVDR